MQLPRKWQSNHFVPDIYPHPQAEREIALFGVFGTTLYDMVRDHCYPDPPDFHIARFKDFFAIVDPGKFQEGVFKDSIQEKLRCYLEDRDSIVRAYCKRTHLDQALFPPPEMTKARQPVFASFGPKYTWADKLDKFLKQKNISVQDLSRIITSAANWLILTELLIIAVFVGFSQPVSWSLVLPQILCIFLFAKIINDIRCRKELRRARREPIICPTRLTLAEIFEDLQKLRRMISYPVYEKRPTADILKVKTTMQRSRNHPSKKAYSISITSEVMLKPIWLLGLAGERVKLNTEIVGESINGPHILFFWFESQGILPGLALQVVNFVSDNICWLTAMKLGSRDKFLSSWKGLDYEAQAKSDSGSILVEYWPEYFPRFNITDRDGNAFIPVNAKRALRRFCKDMGKK